MGFFCTFSPFFPILSAHSFSLSLPLLFFLPPGTPPPLFPHLQSHVGWKKKKLADNNPQRTVQFGEAVITHPKKQRYVLGAALGPWDGMEPHESHVAPSEGGDPIGDGGQRGGRAVGFGRHVAKQSPAAGMDGGSGPRARQLGAKSVGVVWGWGAGGGETRRMGEVKKKTTQTKRRRPLQVFFFPGCNERRRGKKKKKKEKRRWARTARPAVRSCAGRRSALYLRIRDTLQPKAPPIRPRRLAKGLAPLQPRDVSLIFAA